MNIGAWLAVSTSTLFTCLLFLCAFRATELLCMCQVSYLENEEVHESCPQALIGGRPGIYCTYVRIIRI